MAGHVISLHSISKHVEQDRKTFPAQHTGYVRCKQGQHHLLSLNRGSIIRCRSFCHYYGIGTALAACPSAGGLRQ